MSVSGSKVRERGTRASSLRHWIAERRGPRPLARSRRSRRPSSRRSVAHIRKSLASGTFWRRRYGCGAERGAKRWRWRRRGGKRGRKSAEARPSLRDRSSEVSSSVEHVEKVERPLFVELEHLWEDGCESRKGRVGRAPSEHDHGDAFSKLHVARSVGGAPTGRPLRLSPEGVEQLSRLGGREHGGRKSRRTKEGG